jgi:aryl-alcohol dehydrogenase-like predicted oxidoreductase
VNPEAMGRLNRMTAEASEEAKKRRKLRLNRERAKLRRRHQKLLRQARALAQKERP